MDRVIDPHGQILVTGAAGFVGTRVVARLLGMGYSNLRCFIRPSSNAAVLRRIIETSEGSSRVEVITGNLLSEQDCLAAVKDATVIYHLAAGTGSKSFSDAFLNSVVTTRNLLEATLRSGCLRRFVSISSLAVYSNRNQTRPGVLDETCPVEDQPASRGEAYCYAKVKQDELVVEYGRKHGIPFVLLRPGVVYGPGKRAITGRVGIDSFGVFLHLGGRNRIPFTYVDNCAEAIALAGLKTGIDGEVFNIVDDGLPSSREFLRLYKKNVRRFISVYVPHALSCFLCYLWERYSSWSEGQLPPVFSRREWAAYWKCTQYTNEKLKTRVGWVPKVSTERGLQLFFENCRTGQIHA